MLKNYSRLSVNSESYRRVGKISSLAAAFDPKARMNFACEENERRKRDAELEAHWLFLENHPSPTYTSAAKSAGEIMMFFEEQDLSCSGRWIMLSKNCALSSLPGKLHLSNGQQVPGILKEKQLGRKTDFASALFLAALRLANQAGKETGGRIDAARIAQLPRTKIPLGLSNFFR